MSAAHELLDPYSLRARLQPALLALVPMPATVVALFPALWEPARVVFIVAASIGGTVFLSHIARDMGKIIEGSLYEEWGGKPSIAMLRHRDSRIGSAVKKRYHGLLGDVLGRALPSESEEASDPRSADDAYDLANAWLLARCRDTNQFRVLFAENTSYGFRRNLLALRPIAIGLSVLGAAVIAAVYSFSWPVHPNSSVAISASLGLVAYAALVTWGVNRTWVHRAAESYAFRLLEATETLAEPPRQPPNNHGLMRP
jgi:hypothetical protein